MAKETRRAKEGSGADQDDVAHTLESIQSCMSVLQSSKAVSDCEARTASVYNLLHQTCSMVTLT